MAHTPHLPPPRPASNLLLEPHVSFKKHTAHWFLIRR